MGKKQITWKNDTRKLGDLKPWEPNPRQLRKEQAERLRASILKFGYSQPIEIEPDNVILDGHQREAVLLLMDEYGSQHVVDVRVAPRKFTLDERKEYIAQKHRGATGEWNADAMLNLYDGFELLEWGFEVPELESMGFVFDEPEPADAEPQVDRAAELQEKWQTEPGQLWLIGDHRLLIGDCTDAANVARLMGGGVAVLVHADPPYGMGKQNEGIENDNLYREKLDAFQMAWWQACRPHVADNGSAYIWGNAEDLWRLWYCGGLRDSERLTLRNEVVWDKGHGQGQESGHHRQYPTTTERALFFMLGEQGFNNNADNYWEGWEPIRAYLKEQRDLMGWDNAKCKELAGHSPTSGCHWFDASQWMMPTEDVYNAWRNAAKGDGFKREYDELKREFYATRAYFDNTHDNMTDVWQFPRVKGAERWDFATPKPAELVARAYCSSAPAGGLVLAPFGGSGSDYVAGQNTERTVYGLELVASTAAVILERMITAFPDIDIRRADE